MYLYFPVSIPRSDYLYLDGIGMATGTWLKEGDIVEKSTPPLGTLRSPVAPANTSPFPLDPVRIRTLKRKLPVSDVHRVLIGTPPKALHVEVSEPEDAPPVLRCYVFLHLGDRIDQEFCLYMLLGRI